MTTTENLSSEEVTRLFGVLLAELHELTLAKARAAVAAAGIVGVNAPEQRRDPFFAGVEQVFFQLKPEARLSALKILASKFAERETVRTIFAQHGFEYMDGVFVPTALLDQREARHLPQSSATELAKAMKRLVEGDETGAITSACGAVDTLMQDLYEEHGLGNSSTAFAAKINTATQRLKIFEGIRDELIALELSDQDAESIVTEMRKATNHAAQMLQTIRRALGDVHGSKSASHRTAYDAIKWASAICGLFEDPKQSSALDISDAYL